MADEMNNSIDDIFEQYCYLLQNQQADFQMQEALSNYSYLIDTHALAKIINFFNFYSESDRSELWKANLFAIRIYSVITTEIIKYLDQNGHLDKQSFQEPNSLKDVRNLRNKLHQFHRQDFKKKISSIDAKMGRSRNKNASCFDICLEYFANANETEFMGTNIYRFYFDEAADPIILDFMQKNIRTVEQSPLVQASNIELRQSNLWFKQKWKVYSYTNMLKDSCLENEQLIDRLLFVMDDLCCIYEFFKYTILIDEYLLAAPYMIYFFMKVIAIYLDETFDNLSNYLRFSKEVNDKSAIEYIMDVSETDFISYCKVLRNNLHYREQNHIYLGTPNELYRNLLQELDIVKKILNRVTTVMNIEIDYR